MIAVYIPVVYTENRIIIGDAFFDEWPAHDQAETLEKGENIIKPYIVIVRYVS